MNNWHVKIDGVIMYSYNDKNDAEKKAQSLNNKLLGTGSLAYVELAYVEFR